MIYLDNAATTGRKPIQVIEAVTNELYNTANPLRATHRDALKAFNTIYETREILAELLNTDTPENIILTPNATYALNIAIKSTVKSGEHILISDIEHNSVLRPVHALKERLGIEYSVFAERDKTCKGGDKGACASYIHAQQKGGVIVGKTGKKYCRRHVAYSLAGKQRHYKHVLFEK